MGKEISGPYDFSIGLPTTIMCCGPSRSGKTEFCKKTLLHANELFKPGRPEHIMFYYGVETPELKTMIETKMVDVIKKGVPTENEIVEAVDEYGSVLVVIDDGQYNLNKTIAEIATKFSHHSGVTMILLLQNLFAGTIHARNISLSTQFIVLFNNLRDRNQIKVLARQLNWSRGDVPYTWLYNCYEEAMRDRKYNNFVIDLSQNQNDMFRARSNIFNEDGKPMKIYFPNDKTSTI